MRLLLVEDDQMIGESVRTGLQQDGFAVDWLEDVPGGAAGRFQMGVDQAQAELRVESDPASALSRLSDPRGFPALDAQTRAVLKARARARAAAARPSCEG